MTTPSSTMATCLPTVAAVRSVNFFCPPLVKVTPTCHWFAPATVVGTDVKGATARLDPAGTNQWQVGVTFTGSGQKKFTDLTAATVGKQVAIVLDGVVISAPVIQNTIPGDAQITGNFSKDEAQNLANVLK